MSLKVLGVKWVGHKESCLREEGRFAKQLHV